MGLNTSLCIAAFALVGLTATGPARALDRPKDQVILTISGKIGSVNSINGAQFDLAMFDQLPQQTMVAQTPWEKKPTMYSGPLLRDVLSLVKARGTTLQAFALSDYQTTIPFADAKRFDVLMATRMNGAPMPVRTKGPIFIIYPYDSRSELQSLTFYERSAWQLKRLVVE